MKRKFTKVLPRWRKDVLSGSIRSASQIADKDSIPVYTMKRQNWKLREIYSLSDEDLLQFMEELGIGSNLGSSSDFECIGNPDDFVHMRLESMLWNEAMCRGIHPKGQFEDWMRTERESNRGITDARQHLQKKQALEYIMEDFVRYRKRREKFLARQKRMSKTDPKKPLRLIRVEETKPMDEK